MKIINQQSITFAKVIKKQKSAGEHSRLLTYCLIEHVNDGVLMYNTLTGEMVLLEEGEYQSCLLSDYLFSNWFLVPEEHDDRKLACQYRSLLQLFRKKPKGVDGFTILTTTDCDARCFYCYERGRNRIPMSTETAHKVADYIISNHVKLKKHITLRWFGGEPMYNSKVIDIICNRLKTAGVDYSSSMVSNGYLFDEAKVEIANSLWNLKRIQISLDGTESTYNKSKNFIYTEGSAYKRVLKNIGLLLGAGVFVSIRLNMDLYNAEDLKVLTEELSCRFSAYKNFTIYCHPLFETAGHTEHLRSDEKRAAVYKHQIELEKMFECKGYKGKGRLQNDAKVFKCMADSDRSVVIAPTGDIGLCEHFSESEFFSHVNNPDTKDMDVVDSFKERWDEEEICNSCAYYPLCVRLKKCEEDKYCFPEVRDLNIFRTKRAMVKTYERWKNAQTEDVDQDIIDIQC